MTGIREDGYHLIDAEMVTVDLVDELTISDHTTGEPREQGNSAFALSTTLAGPALRGLPVGDGPDNLIARALAHAGRRARVQVRKNIPAGGGLGGGSANAAAILRWAGHTTHEAIVASAALGADVPFCVMGGRARVRGIGEIIDPLPYEKRTFTMLTPPFGVSTPAVYRAWDALGGPHNDDGPNDLEPAALVVEPRLAEWRDRLEQATGRRAVLAGSGSTWFVDGAYAGDGRDGRVVVTTTRPIAP